MAQAEVGPHDVLYKVQHGDSVGHLADHSYGDWQDRTRIVEANRDRVQPDGRSLRETGTIQPGWTLVIHEPTQGVRAVLAVARALMAPATLREQTTRLVSAADAPGLLVRTLRSM
jgi:hypothetical protein